MNTTSRRTFHGQPISNSGIDIVICTYNRLNYVKKCVASILPQLKFPETRLTIIDNRSDDGTAEWVKDLMKHHPDVQYIFEQKQGLSQSRNTAVMMTAYSHILYLDDDGIAPDGFMDTAVSLLHTSFDWDALGGPYYAMYEGKMPEKNPDDMFSFALPYETPTVLPTEYIRGGCMMWKTEVLRDLGGFDTSLGMKGKLAGYGEEIEIQQRMRQRDYKIAYAPGLFIFHAVRPEKERIRWRLYGAYARRRDKRLFEPLPLHAAFWLVARTLAGRIIWTPVHLFSWMIRSSYTWQQCVIDILEPLMFSWGEWIGSVRSEKR